MGPLIGNDFAVTEDFYDIGRDKVTGRICDANVRSLNLDTRWELARYEIRNDNKANSRTA